MQEKKSPISWNMGTGQIFLSPFGFRHGLRVIRLRFNGLKPTNEIRGAAGPTLELIPQTESPTRDQAPLIHFIEVIRRDEV